MDFRSYITPLLYGKLRDGLLLMLVASYALLYLHTDKVASVLTGLLALSAVVMVVSRQPYTRQLPLIPLFILVVLWQLLVWGSNHGFYPEFAERSPKAERLGVWFMLLPIAFFTQQRARHVYGVWLVSVMALLLAPWWSGKGIVEIVQAFNGVRVAFGVNNAQHMGMLYGVAFLGLSIFSPRFFSYIKRSYTNSSSIERVMKTLLGLGFVSAGFATAAGLILTQTRAVWLAILATMVASSVWWLSTRLWGIKKAKSRRWFVHKSLIVCALVLMVSLPLLFADIVKTRLDSTASYGWMSILKDPAAANSPSIRVRYVTWMESLSWIAERPVTGWGREGSDAVVNATPELSPSEKKLFRHLHNTYLDLTVNYGLVGLYLFFSLLYLISKNIYHAFGKDAASSDIVLFWNMFLIYWLIVNMFESYMFYSTGNYAFTLVAGGLIGLCLNRRCIDSGKDSINASVRDEDTKTPAATQ